MFKGFFREVLDPVPVFKEALYETLALDADVKMNEGFDPVDPAMSSSWRSVSSNAECFNQKELSKLTRDLNFSKENLELLASRLK